jgi:hypothetical protein
MTEDPPSASRRRRETAVARPLFAEIDARRYARSERMKTTNLDLTAAEPGTLTNYLSRILQAVQRRAPVRARSIGDRLLVTASLASVLFLLLALPAGAQAQFEYYTNGNTILITRYTGPGGLVAVPEIINGLPVVGIGFETFSGNTNLNTVTIPKSVVGFSWGAFGGCPNLTEITVDALNPFLSSLDGVLFNKDQTALIQYPEGKPGPYAIPDSVTSIGREAFAGCANLTELNIGTNLTSIMWDALLSCPRLTAFSVDALNPTFSSVGGVLFDKWQSLLLRCPQVRAGSYEIPNGVTGIGWGAFLNCTGLTNILIPDSVVGGISAYAFHGCTGLRRVTIPSGVQSVLSFAFAACTNLARVYFRGNAPEFGNDSYDVFMGSPATTLYYLPGTIGWPPTVGDQPTALWRPEVQTSDGSFGVRTNGFEFNIAWAAGLVVVVEACANLSNPLWSPLQTNAFTGDTSYFSDPDWTNYSKRFYRIRWP